jgi:hypothetical protein
MERNWPSAASYSRAPIWIRPAGSCRVCTPGVEEEPDGCASVAERCAWRVQCVTSRRQRVGCHCLPYVASGPTVTVAVPVGKLALNTN